MIQHQLFPATGWMGDPKRGAAMGRTDVLPENKEAPIKLRLSAMNMVDGGDYDIGGAYWGCWSPEAGGMYVAWGGEDENEAILYIRALDRPSAKAQIRKKLPNATFYR